MSPSTCWRCCRPRGVWCVREWRPIIPKIKSISAQFEKIAADPRFRFFGNITIGEHVQSAELAERYDAVIYAIGAQSDRPLSIPGEELPGSVAAVDFVGWYNAHPHFEQMAPDLAGARAIVVGNGNVALDVARILVADPKLLSETDIADHALESLHGHGVEEVVSSAGAAPCRRRSPRWSCGNWPTSSRWRMWTWWSTRPISTPSPKRISKRRARPSSRTQGDARLRRHGAEERQAPDRFPVPDVADRDQR